MTTEGKPGAEQPPRTTPDKLWRIVQWGIAVFWLLIALMAFMSDSKLSSPEAPVNTYWIATATILTVGLLAAPPVFFRLPRRGKQLTYVGLFGSFLLFGHAVGGVEEAYDRTPEGQRQLAHERAEEERAAVSARNLQQQVEAQERAQASLDLAASKERMCRELVAAITDLAQSEQGLEIFEVNDISVSQRVSETKPVTCFGDAITSRGELSVTYGLETTPQGQTLVTMRLR